MDGPEHPSEELTDTEFELCSTYHSTALANAEEIINESNSKSQVLGAVLGIGVGDSRLHSELRRGLLAARGSITN